MTFDQFWTTLVTKNRLDRFERVKFTIVEMERMLKLAYDEGRDAGAAEVRESINRMIGDDPIGALFGR